MKRMLLVLSAVTLLAATQANAAGPFVTLNGQVEQPEFPCAGCFLDSVAGTVTSPLGGGPSGALFLGSGGVLVNDFGCAAGVWNGELRVGAAPYGFSALRVGAALVMTFSGSQTAVGTGALFLNPAQTIAACGPGGTPGPVSMSLAAAGVFAG